jgi:hypothetical protein
VRNGRSLLEGLKPSQFIVFFVLFVAGGMVVAGKAFYLFPFTTLGERWGSIAVVVMVVGFAGLAGLLMQWSVERTAAIRRKRRTRAAARAESAQQSALLDAEALANLPVLGRDESYVLAWLLCRDGPRFEADIDEEVITDLVRKHIVRATPTPGMLGVAASVWARREDILTALKPDERAAMTGIDPPWR